MLFRFSSWRLRLRYVWEQSGTQPSDDLLGATSLPADVLTGSIPHPAPGDAEAEAAPAASTRHSPCATLRRLRSQSHWLTRASQSELDTPDGGNRYQ